MPIYRKAKSEWHPTCRHLNRSRRSWTDVADREIARPSPVRTDVVERVMNLKFLSIRSLLLLVFLSFDTAASAGCAAAVPTATVALPTASSTPPPTATDTPSATATPTYALTPAAVMFTKCVPGITGEVDATSSIPGCGSERSSRASSRVTSHCPRTTSPARSANRRGA